MSYREKIDMSTERVNKRECIVPDYSVMEDTELYTANIIDEYRQCVDEGLDIEKYKVFFDETAKLPKGNLKEKFGDVIYDIVMEVKLRADYKYIEPSELSNIKKLRKPYEIKVSDNGVPLDEKIYGAWLGRVCGCMLGKPVESMVAEELTRFLKATDNYPMHRYILRTDVDSINTSEYKYELFSRLCADEIDGMPIDDDTNYVVLAQKLIEEYGRDFMPRDVAQNWLKSQLKHEYWTAERVAYCNFIKGYEPPYSAVYKNPFREWIGAQIRTDYYGYINPGNPELAAEMAWRDASISHVKNGIYGAMLAAAMIAVAAVTDNAEDIILAGLAQIPCTSRLYEDVMFVYDSYKNGMTQKDCFSAIAGKYDDTTMYGLCHTNSNAMIVAASLLYGGNDYGKTICICVEVGFDTDCNGATVGSIFGMAHGVDSIPEYWSKPLNDTIHTSIVGAETVSISKAAKKTMEHIRK